MDDWSSDPFSRRRKYFLPFLSFLAKNGFLRLFNGKQHLKGATILMLGLQSVKIISKRLPETIRRGYILEENNYFVFTNRLSFLFEI